LILKEIIAYLEDHAPLNYQESYDNSGLIVGDIYSEVTSAIVSLDVTEEVIDEALETGANLIIAHYPIVFKGLKTFTGDHYVQRVVMKAIKNDVAIYAIHTNLDNVLLDGVNNKIADKIGLFDTYALVPYPSLTVPERPRGSGLIGELKSEMEWSVFLHTLKQKMEINVIRYTKPISSTIKKVAVCGGSGSFLLPQAITAGADVFITADFKYHEFFESNDRIMIADIGHYESEQFTIELIKDLIIKKFSNFAVRSTRIITNPINYL